MTDQNGSMEDDADEYQIITPPTSMLPNGTHLVDMEQFKFSLHSNRSMTLEEAVAKIQELVQETVELKTIAQSTKQMFGAEKSKIASLEANISMRDAEIKTLKERLNETNGEFVDGQEYYLSSLSGTALTKDPSSRPKAELLMSISHLEAELENERRSIGKLNEELRCLKIQFQLEEQMNKKMIEEKKDLVEINTQLMSEKEGLLRLARRAPPLDPNDLELYSNYFDYVMLTETENEEATMCRESSAKVVEVKVTSGEEGMATMVEANTGERKEFEKLIAQLKAKDRDLSNYEAVVAAMLGELLARKNQTLVVSSTVSSTNKECPLAEQETMTSHLHSKPGDIEALKTEVRLIIADYNRVRMEKSQLADSCTDLQGQLNCRQFELNNLRIRVESNKGVVEKAVNEQKNVEQLLSTKYESLKKDMDKLSLSRNEETSKSNDVIRNLGATVSTQGLEIEKMRETLRRMEEENKTLTEKCKRAEEETNMIQEQCTVLQQEHNLYVQRNAAEQGAEALDSMAYTSLQGKDYRISVLTAEKNSLSEVMQDTKLENEAIQKALGEKLSAIKELERKLGDNEYEIAALKIQSNQHREDFEQERRARERMHEEIEQLRNERGGDCNHVDGEASACEQCRREKAQRQQCPFCAQLCSLEDIHAHVDTHMG